MRVLVTAALLTCAGCFTAAPPIAMTPQPVEVAKAPSPVTPESITEDYASGYQRLWDELDREYQRIHLSKTLP